MKERMSTRERAHLFRLVSLSLSSLSVYVRFQESFFCLFYVFYFLLGKKCPYFCCVINAPIPVRRHFVCCTTTVLRAMLFVVGFSVQSCDHSVLYLSSMKTRDER